MNQIIEAHRRQMLEDAFLPVWRHFIFRGNPPSVAPWGISRVLMPRYRHGNLRDPVGLLLPVTAYNTAIEGYCWAEVIEAASLYPTQCSRVFSGKVVSACHMAARALERVPHPFLDQMQTAHDECAIRFTGQAFTMALRVELTGVAKAWQVRPKRSRITEEHSSIAC